MMGGRGTGREVLGGKDMYADVVDTDRRQGDPKGGRREERRIGQIEGASRDKVSQGKQRK